MRPSAPVRLSGALAAPWGALALPIALETASWSFWASLCGLRPNPLPPSSRVAARLFSAVAAALPPFWRFEEQRGGLSSSLKNSAVGQSGVRAGVSSPVTAWFSFGFRAVKWAPAGVFQQTLKTQSGLQQTKFTYTNQFRSQTQKQLKIYALKSKNKKILGSHHSGESARPLSDLLHFKG